jgi:hypothetical protein
VASFAVLGDDNPNWRPDHFGYRRWGTEAGLRFPIAKLLDYAARRSDLEASPNPFATVVLAHLDTQETRQAPGARMDRKYRLMKRVLERGLDAKRARQLFRLVDWQMELPTDLKIKFREEITRYTKEKHMPFVSVLDEIINENAMRAQMKGHQDGIEAVLDVRFGQAGTRLMPEIRQITDDAKLENILLAAKTIPSPDELRKLWTNGADG